MDLMFLLNTPPGRIIDFDLQTVLQILGNMTAVGILGFILTKLLYKPVCIFLNNRTERIRKQLNDAKEGRAAAGELRAKYDRQLKDIDIERTAILEEARKLAAEQREHILNTAKDEAKELKDRANMEVMAERDRIRDELHTAVIDISSGIAEKLLGVSIDKNAHDRLFAEGLAELEAVVF